MAEQRTGVPLADGLSWTLDATKEHPERYMTILGGAAPLSLSNAQALRLFEIMLSHIAQFAGNDLHNDALLQQVDLVQLFHSSLYYLTNCSDANLENRRALWEALEQYYFAYDFRETLMIAMADWETTLREQYDRMESAASKIGVDLEELRELEEDDLDDETIE